MQFKVTSLDAVPEALRAAYVQKGDAFVLDVDEGLVPEADVKGLKAKNEELLGEKKKLLGQYNELLENHKLTDAQRADLQGKVDDLEKQVLSSDELAAKKIKQTRDEKDAEVAKERSEKEKYRSRLFDSIIQTEVSRAAEELGVSSSRQLHGLLNLEVNPRVEALTGDDGKPTGEFAAMATIKVKEGDKVITKDVPLSEAAKHIVSLPENKNLGGPNYKTGGGAIGGKVNISGQAWRDLPPTERINAARGVQS